MLVVVCVVTAEVATEVVILLVDEREVLPVACG